MSTSPESKSPEAELDLDLHFLPAWAQKGPDTNRYEQYKGDEGSSPRGGNFRDRRGGPGGPGGGGGGGPRRDGPGGARPPRRDGPGGGGSRGPGGPSRGGDRGPQGGRSDQGQRPRPGGGRPEERREALPPLPQLELNFIPEDKGVESLARQIKLTGRAYPLFDIAFLVLKKPERYHVEFKVEKKPDGQPVQPLFVCGLDDTLWLSEQEATDHVLSKHFATFYSVERIPTDPPKGTYTFVAQCGMSGTILGPPNYHDYQNKLRKLHAERFSRLPFDAYKARVKIVREEAIVKKWLEDQSFRNEFTCLNIPETIKLGTREEVEQHFKATHLPNVVKSVDSFTVAGAAAQTLPNRTLQNLVRRAWDDQMRFPLKIVNILSQQFARQGLQFFKVNKTVTHVAVARPHYLDLNSTPVSEGVRRIVEYIDASARGTTRRKLIEAFAPGTPHAPEAPGATTDPAAETTPPSPEMAALISDLHWLIHEGHVIEFANGIIETAKKPLPKPARPEPKPKSAAKASPEAAEVPAAEAMVEHTTGAAAEQAAATEPAPEPAPAEPAAPAATESANPAEAAQNP